MNFSKHLTLLVCLTLFCTYSKANFLTDFFYNHPKEALVVIAGTVAWAAYPFIKNTNLLLINMCNKKGYSEFYNTHEQNDAIEKLSNLTSHSGNMPIWNED